MKILHIDDNSSTTTAFSRILKLKNYDYDICSNPKKGLELIKQENYDVIFLDLAMPELSGFDILEDLKKAGKPTNNIIILTATYLSENETSKLNSFDVKEILLKPVKINHILECLSINDSILVDS